MKRTARIARIALLAALVAGLVAFPAAVAAKGKPSAPAGSTGGTIKLVPLTPSADGLLHYGDQVTFDVYTSATAYPWVLLECTQNGSLVYRYANGIFPTSLMQVFTLGLTPAWTGGAADCRAYLQKRDSRKTATLATLSFHVYA